MPWLWHPILLLRTSVMALFVSISYKGRDLFLLKPSTFMNLSGNAVSYWLKKENIPLENLLVIVDDLALASGKHKIKVKRE